MPCVQEVCPRCTRQPGTPVHEYGPEVCNQPRFSDPNMEQVLAGRWEAGFGFIHTEQIAPLLIGEFGAKAVDLSTVEGRWITQFATTLR